MKNNCEKFDQHITPLLPRIRSIIALRMGNRATFDDDLQAVLIHLFLNIEKYDETRGARQWVEQVVRNFLSNLYRNRKKDAAIWGDVERTTPEAAAHTPTGEESWTSDGFPDPGSCFNFAAYANRRLLRAVMGLLPHYREGLLLRADGESYDYIAQRLGLTVAATEVLVSRARAAVRKGMRG